ncbi:hypothetical protein RND81_02G155800 [Saponaria officinalis]|uniref:Uncharacterized protein n=1 Tax=Saponaria officinalis TaxID=3572 RepID=A0AAW1MXE9_SAPOF
MLKSLVTAEYSPDCTSAAANLTVTATDFKLQASVSEATFDVGPTVSNLVVTLEKPASFSIEYNIPNQDLRFQFMNTGNLFNKEVTTTYTHWIKDNKTTLEGTLLMDSRNKLSTNYEIGTNNCKFKYSYYQGDGGTIFEPCYDLANNSWNFSLSQQFSDENLLKASCVTSTKVLGLEWSQTSTCNGSFKKSTRYLVRIFQWPASERTRIVD